MDTPKVPNPVPTQNPREAQRQAHQESQESAAHGSSQPPTQTPPPPSRQQPPMTPTTPSPPVPAPPATPPLPLTTAHQLVAMLDEATAMLSRHPHGQEDAMHDLAVMRAKIAAVGFNPSPDEMHTLHMEVAALADKARLYEESQLAARVPVPITMDIVEDLLDTADTVAGRLHTNRDEALHNIQRLRDRVSAAVVPHNQQDVDSFHVAVLTLLTHLETQAGTQGV